MKKIWKKMISIVYVGCLLTGNFERVGYALTANTQMVEIQSMEGKVSGTWGTCTWSMDGDGILTITGGIAKSLDYLAISSPWNKVSDSITKVIITGKISFAEGNNRLCNLFYKCENLKEIQGMDYLDTSNVTNMDAMFYGCSQLEQVDVSHFDTSNVTNMRQMFAGCSKLTKLDISNFDLSKLTYYSREYPNEELFYNCNLTEIDIPQKFKDEDSKNRFVKNLRSEGLKFGKWKNTVTNQMYDDKPHVITESQKYIYLGDTIVSGKWGECNWNIKDGVMILEGGMAESLQEIEVPWGDYKKDVEHISIQNKIGFQELADLSGLFESMRNMKKISGLNYLDTTNVVSMERMFNECSELIKIDISSFNTENVTNMQMMFKNCGSLQELKIGSIHTENVTNMQHMFAFCSDLKELDVTNLNTSQVIDMSGLFRNCSNLRILDLSGFNTEKVTNISRMFEECTSLVKLDLSSFNTGNIVYASYMFSGCTSLKKLTLYSFSTEKLAYINGIFDDVQLYEFSMPKKLESNIKQKFINAVLDAMAQGSWKDETINTLYINKPETLETAHFYTMDYNEKDSITISDGNYCFRFYDGDTYELAQDIIVKYNNSKIEELNTVYQFAPVEGVNNLFVTYHGITTEYILEPYNERNKINFITLPAKSEQLVLTQACASYQEKKYGDVLNQCVTIDRGNLEVNSIEINYEFAGSEVENISKISLIQKGITEKELAVTNNIIDKKINIPIQNIQINTDIYIKVETQKGDAYEFLLQLVVTNRQTNTEIGIEGGEASITIGENVPLLGGLSFSMDIPDMPITMVTSGDVTRIGINISADTLSKDDEMRKIKRTIEEIYDDYESGRKESQKKTEELFKKAMDYDSSGSLDKKFTLKVIGYGEFVGKPEEQSVGIKLIFSAGFKLTYGKTIYVPISVVTLPIAVSVEGEAGADIATELKYKIQENMLSGDLGIDLKVAISVFAGIGIYKVACAGVYGKAALDIAYNIISNERKQGLQSVILSGAMGLEVMFLNHIKSIELLNGTWNLFNNEDIQTNLMDDRAKLYDSSSYELNTKIYNSEINENSNDYLIENTYSAANPRIVKCGNKYIMVYEAITQKRNSEDNCILMYTVYDIQKQSWSEAKAVFDNGTLDGEFEMVSDDENVWLVYQDASTIFEKDASLDDICGYLNIVVQKFEYDNNTFSSPVVISNGGYNYLPSVFVQNGNTYFTWIHNDKNDFFAQNGENQLIYQAYEDENWKNQKTIVTNLNTVIGMAIQNVNEEIQILYVEDTDTDLSTKDAELDIINMNGEIVYQQKGLIDNLNYIENDEISGVSWCNNSLLYQYTQNGEVSIITENAEDLNYALYKIQNGVVYYTSQTEDGMAIYQKNILEKDAEAMIITDETDYINYFDICDEKLIYMEMKTNEKISNLIEKNINTQKNCDIEIQQIKIAGDSIVDGSGIPIEVRVKNIGLEEVKALKIIVKDATGEILSEKIAENGLASGEEEFYTVVLDTNVLNAQEQYSVTVIDISGVEQNIENNTEIFMIDKSEISVDTTLYQIKDKYLLAVTVTNYSPVQADGIVDIKSMEGNIIKTIDIDGLKQNETKEVILEVDSDKQNQVITVEVGCNKDYYKFNNTSAKYIPSLIMMGDIDGNGKVNLQDSALLRRYLAGWDVTIDENAADVDGNGKVNLQDSALIRRYLAGWDVELK